MDLRDWILADHELLGTRLAGQVLDHVPPERQRELVDGGGSSITFLLWHLARHHDLAINGVVRGLDLVLEQWRARLGAHSLGPSAGLAEAEDRGITDQLDPEAVIAYQQAVATRTASWLSEVDLATLETVPDAGAALASAGIGEAELSWLYAMWEAKPVSFFVRWEDVGHGVTHVGEMVSIRNRMGLSPF